MTKVLGTVDVLSKALMVSKVPGEDATKIETESLSMGVSKENPATLGNKPFDIGDSKVSLPKNTSAFGNGTLDQVVCKIFQLNFNSMIDYNQLGHLYKTPAFKINSNCDIYCSINFPRLFLRPPGTMLVHMQTILSSAGRGVVILKELVF